MKIQKIGNAKHIQDVIDYLQEADDTLELLVLRSHRDPETGVKHLEWWTTEVESRVWITGALHYLVHKLLESGADDNGNLS